MSGATVTDLRVEEHDGREFIRCRVNGEPWALEVRIENVEAARKATLSWRAENPAGDPQFSIHAGDELTPEEKRQGWAPRVEITIPAGFITDPCDLPQSPAAEHDRQYHETDAPIPMVLHCPACGLQHIDAPDSRGFQRTDTTLQVGWDNPPHRSHLCAGCGFQWRPADVPTVGVEAVTTRGKNDGPLFSECRKSHRDGSCDCKSHSHCPYRPTL